MMLAQKVLACTSRRHACERRAIFPFEKYLRNGPYVPQFYDNQFDLTVEELSVKLGDFPAAVGPRATCRRRPLRETFRRAAAVDRKVRVVTYCCCDV